MASIPKTKPRVYVETSVISYLSNRPSTNAITLSRQLLTQQWWRYAQLSCELYTSDLVIGECLTGHPEAAQRRIDNCKHLTRLNTTAHAYTLGEQLVRMKAIPATEPEDALHIALASVHGMDYIASWNFSHMVGAVAKLQLRDALKQLQQNAPILATPEELMELPQS